MKKEFIKLITDKLCIVKDDLTENELEIINISFTIIEEKLEDLKLANDTIKRITIENLNLKAYNDNKDYETEEYLNEEDDCE